ncbi:uncharacterized protein [Oscarella lobularis]|uniref:uncharacterized protein n=1 Tax=Oscarella lobularis TaxID=121494 RepID=UPI003313138E
MKFYVHYEAGPELTMAFKWGEGQSGTLADVVTLFVANYDKRFPKQAISKANLKIVGASGDAINFEKSVSNVVRDKMDLYLIRIEEVSDQKSSEDVSVAVEKTSEKDEEKTEVVSRALDLAHKLLTDNDAKAAASVLEHTLKKSPKCLQALIELAIIMHAAGRFSDAVKYMRRAIEVNSSQRELLRHLADYLLDAGDSSKALETYDEYLKRRQSDDPKIVDDVKVCMARCFRVEGQENAALYLLGDVLKRNREHVEGLLEYARIVHKRGPEMRSEAFAICVALLPEMKNNSSYHKFFASLVQEEGGLDLLLGELKEAGKSCAALSYVAILFRDYGAVNEAAALLKRGLDIDPNAFNAFLAYIHTLQMCARWDDAYVELRDFISRPCAVGGLKLKWLSSLLPNVSSIYLAECRPGDGDIPDDLVDFTPRFSPQRNADELDLTAILFTLVKVVFFSGALNMLRPICKVIDCLHADRNLHKTPIRNEAAYFSCINQALETKGIHFNLISEKLPFIYLAGESHAIPISWRRIQYKGCDHVIHPVLATGLKIWHLRPDCCFYPKISFTNAMKKVPDGSAVTFCLGEIDCREGLNSAVRKNKYETLERAMSVLIDTYVASLKDLRKKRNFEVYVHPVPPVLNETRRIVLDFNKMLRERLARSKTLTYLDFGEELVTEDGKELRKQYDFDGTHLNPVYLRLLESAINTKKFKT